MPTKLAVAYGFAGTETDWLASLRGDSGSDGVDGSDGASAYKLAVAGGFDGTESEWLESLKGNSGTDGNDGASGASGSSAYELAVVAGFNGTESQWLASLKGEPGKDGNDGAEGPAGPGLSAASVYVKQASVPVQNSSFLMAMSCDEGDIALSGYHSFNNGAELVHSKPQSSGGWEFAVQGSTVHGDFLGVRCLDVTP